MIRERGFPKFDYGFLKIASHLLHDGWVELKISGCRYHVRAFQLELDILGTKNFEISSVVKNCLKLDGI